MRSLAVALLLTLPLLAGCVSKDTDEPPLNTGDAALLAQYASIPEGAEYVPINDGMALIWKEQPRPFRANFSLPEGATMVRFVADPGEGETVGIAMWNEDTGRRRCNQQTVIDLGESLEGPRSCSSIAAIDDPGTMWAVTTSAPSLSAQETTGVSETDFEVLPEVRIEFYHTPLDGPAAAIDWAKLTKATSDLQPTFSQRIRSFDDTELWVEVTLPEGEGPWPTVISASPYNGVSGRIGETWSGPEDKGTPAMWTYWTQDWAKRGYAAVNVDVRGYGLSDGCIEVWGINEQLDQKFIVEWATRQDWSDGHIGFYGQSYVATTPLEAAVHQAEGLDAIIMVAPVVDAYFDWHYGGVPNGESSGSPAAYRVLTDVPATPPTTNPEEPDPEYPGDLQEWGTDMQTALKYTTTGPCEVTMEPSANDPRAIHGEFFDERDFGARSSDIEAAVLYTQGFEDANVKSAMIEEIFNNVQTPRLGIFGHWLHQHPPRMDAEVLFLGWMEQFVKGIDLGIDAAYPDVIVSVDPDTRRAADEWPPLNAATTQWGIDLDANSLGPDGGSGARDISVLPQSSTPNQAPDDGTYDEQTTIVLETVLDVDTPIVYPSLDLDLTVNQENVFIYARLDEIYADGGSRLVTWGMKNIALGDDYDTYEALTPGERYSDSLPFRPTEHIMEAGSTLRLTIRGVESHEPTGAANQQPGTVTVHGEGTTLVLPVIDMADYTAIALTERP